MRPENVVVLVSLAALGYLYFARTKPAEKTVIGTKVVRTPVVSSFSGNWKRELPVPTNIFGSHPYGWSGSSAGSYLLQ